MRVLPVLVLLALLLISSFSIAASGRGEKFDDCPSGHFCEASPDGSPFPPDLVTGHAVYARYVVERDAAGEGPTQRPVQFEAPPDVLPRDIRGPAPSDTPTSLGEGGSLVQVECVSWFNGGNLDVRPDVAPAPNGEGDAPNGFFSDEDTPTGAFQDYDPGRDLEGCVPGSGGIAYPPHYGRPTDLAAIGGYFASIIPETPWSPGSAWYGNHAVVVEAGDCAPSHGRDFRYRGHLDFVDPNGIYHEVQEYDYVCDGPVAPVSYVAPGILLAEATKDLFPWTFTDPYNFNGCERYRTPADVVVMEVPPRADLNETRFDLGHKCNGSIQDLVTERLWITEIHEPTWDPSIQNAYTFALVADTCSGRNIAEGWDARDSDRQTDALDYLLDSLGIGQPTMEVCHDGSSFSFDDTSRGRTTHDGPPALEEEIMRGNPLDFDPNSPTFGKHRTICRHNAVVWSWNDYPGSNRAHQGPLGLTGERPQRYEIGEDCYPEDHKTAPIDIYVFDADPTGLFAVHSNGLTGPNDYVNDPSIGPDWDPREG